MTTSPVVTITDELVAELGQYSRSIFPLEVNRETIRALLAERAELKRDAARYRWLRDIAPVLTAVWPLIAMFSADGSVIRGEYGGEMLLSRESADAVIDAAMLAAAPAAPAADAGIVDMYRHLQKVTPYRFKKIQDASITDGGDVMYFHKDRFDAALLADMAAHCAAKGVV